MRAKCAPTCANQSSLSAPILIKFVLELVENMDFLYKADLSHQPPVTMSPYIPCMHAATCSKDAVAIGPFCADGQKQVAVSLDVTVKS